ncbi:MAG TPA: hypothetical protein VNT03_15665 [Baekduia sp.]|nr:hypothetical protein [Baekduia sp.]
MSAPLSDVLRDYVGALNERDGETRLALLRTAVTDDLRVVPGYAPDAPVIAGAEAFSQHIGAVIEATRPPAYRLELLGDPDAHHDWVRFHWHVVDDTGGVLSAGDRAIEGLDVAHLSSDGRLDTIVAFLGHMPDHDEGTP